MSRISYVKGRFVEHHEAMVHMEDRGYQFADGVYEVAAMYNRKLLDTAAHLERLERSLTGLTISMPVSKSGFMLLIDELLERNNRQHGLLYIQVTRGLAAKREHVYPADIKPTLTMTVLPTKLLDKKLLEGGVGVITRPDIRWGRCDIKSVALLPNILARQESYALGLRETWQVKEDGTVTEGTSSNSYIVNQAGEVITHPANNRILGGITRDMLIVLARANGIKVHEQPFHVNDIAKASEAFLTSTSQHVLPVVKVDDKPVGNGKVGPVTQKLMALYRAHVESQVGALCH